MTYDTYKSRVAANLNRDDLTIYIPDWINEIREEISLFHPFTFLMYEKTIPLVASTFSYEIDAAGSTGRYGGVMFSLIYDSSTTKIKLPCINSKLFDRLYPSTSAADPTVYTVRGSKFYVDKIPTSVTSKNFISKYYQLPDRLVTGSEEGYMDKRYHSAVIAGCCAKGAAFVMSPELVTYWTQTYENEVKKMIAQDAGLRLGDVDLRISEAVKKSNESVRD